MRAPKFTAEHMPAGLGGLVPGQTTEAEVMAVLGHAKREADQALGGDMVLHLQAEPAIMLESTSKARIMRQARAAGFAEDRVQREA